MIMLFLKYINLQTWNLHYMAHEAWPLAVIINRSEIQENRKQKAYNIYR